MSEPSYETEDRDLVETLKGYLLVQPDPDLRRRLLCSLEEPVKLPRFEMTLRWFLAVLVATLIWAHWHEGQMFRRSIGQSSSFEVRTGKIGPDATAGVEVEYLPSAAILAQLRMRLPLNHLTSLIHSLPSCGFGDKTGGPLCPKYSGRTESSQDSPT